MNKRKWLDDDQDQPTISKFSTKCAKLLWRKVKSNFPRLVSWRSADVYKWAKDFEFLERKYGKAEVLSLLNCHIRRMGSEYWPDAYSAKAFRNKWLQLQAARLRFRKIDASKQEGSRA